MAKFKGAVLSCQTCGTSFKVSPSRIKTAKFCSPACLAVHRNKVNSKPKVSLTCRACGKTFLEHQSHADRRKYCSLDCRHGHPEHLAEASRRVSGANNPMWGGGISDHSEGYLYQSAPSHPFASRGYVFQHRLVAEQYLRETDPESQFLIKLGDQMYLDPKAIVHHKNEDRKDNRIENLEVMTRTNHMSLHRKLRRNTKIREEDSAPS